MFCLFSWCSLLFYLICFFIMCLYLCHVLRTNGRDPESRGWSWDLVFLFMLCSCWSSRWFLIPMDPEILLFVVGCIGCCWYPLNLKSWCSCLCWFHWWLFASQWSSHLEPFGVHWFYHYEMMVPAFPSDITNANDPLL